MDQKTYRFYSSVPLENNDLKQRLEMKFNDVYSFNDNVNNIKQMITYLKDKNHTSKRNYRN